MKNKANLSTMVKTRRQHNQHAAEGAAAVSPPFSSKSSSCCMYTFSICLMDCSFLGLRTWWEKCGDKHGWAVSYG